MTKYRVIGPLPINDVPTGDMVELDDETAAQLIASGHVAAAARPAKSNDSTDKE